MCNACGWRCSDIAKVRELEAKVDYLVAIVKAATRCSDAAIAECLQLVDYRRSNATRRPT